MYSSSTFTSDRTIRWVENLAEQELSIALGSQTSVDLCSTKDEILTTETAQFVKSLELHLDYLVKLFNAKVSESLHVKVKKSSSPSDGLSLLRNGIRLDVFSKNPGSVHLQCVRLDPESVLSSGTVEARFATFHDVEWAFLGAPVLSEQVARHYLTEFLQVSRDQRLS